MDWNGVIGSVASVVNTALPLFFGAFEKNSRAGAIETAPIGPATLYTDGGVFKIGNFHFGGGKVGDPGNPVMLNFTHPQGGAETNLAVQLDFGQAFDAEPWLKTFTNGDITVGTTEPPETSQAGGPLTGLWTYATQAVLGIGGTITAVVNPSLTLRLRLEVNNQIVVMTAIGAATILGATYMLTANNNSGRQGTRSGNLQSSAGKGRSSGPGDETDFQLALPTGVDYTAGIYGLQLQLPVELSSSSVATDKRISFETVSKEKIKAMQLIRAKS